MRQAWLHRKTCSSLETFTLTILAFEPNLYRTSTFGEHTKSLEQKKVQSFSTRQKNSFAVATAHY